jgi:predicted ATPase
MIENVEIKNFRCFRDLSVPLKPLTVLIGANDTGKSTFLEAIRLVTGNDRLDPTDAFRHSDIRETSISIDTDKGRAWINSQEHSPLSDFRRVALFRLTNKGVSLESKAIPDQLGGPAFGEDGSNVPGFLDNLLRRDRNRFDEIVESLKRLIPGFENIDIRMPQVETRRIDLVIENGFNIPADSASAGIRLLIFFSALAFHPDPPDLILIEEPENGIHPKRLGEVMGLLRKITRGENGLHPAQVILTTHSPYLLDSIDLDTDQVLVFRREADGSRAVEPADRERLSVFLDEFMLGEVWFNQGEEGLVSRK